MSKPVNIALGYKCIEKIFISHTIEEIKGALSAFITATEDVIGVENGMYTHMLCNWFEEALAEWTGHCKTSLRSTGFNTVIVPTEHSPVRYLCDSVPVGCTPANLIGILKKVHNTFDESLPCADETYACLNAKAYAEHNA